MPDEKQDDKPKIIKRTLSPETHAERKVKSIFTEADIVECKQMVASMKAPGKYFEKGIVKKISAAAVKKLFGDDKKN